MLNGLKLLLLAVLFTAVASKCKTNFDCSLNGVCSGAAGCACDKPWKGEGCGVMGYKTVSPAIPGGSLYPSSDPRNTWNGPIVTGPDGIFHIYDPIYKVKSLGGPTSIKHGTASKVTGPYNWSNPDLLAGKNVENPAFVVFKNESSGKSVYSLWVGGVVYTASGPHGPFSQVPGFTYPGGNPAPIYHGGAFYLTNQRTTQVYTTPTLEANAKWTIFGNISHAPVPKGMVPEDPFMWIDKRGNWHIINHAYNTGETVNCGTSQVSDHFFSADGKDWKMLVPNVEPYAHTVHYDDGTSHTYTTLERPSIHFDATGQMTHLNLAADLITGDEGCANRTDHNRGHGCACTNCKWTDHAGTIIIALDV